MPALVSVICLCHNHEAFVREALESVLWQSYPHYEMIIVDDASTDQSVKIIEKFLEDIPAYQMAYTNPELAHSQGPTRVEFLPLSKNQGNCIAFNQGWQRAQGEYVIDFSTDDLMVDQRLEKQVAFWERLNPSVGVIFSNALLIDQKGQVLGYHFPINAKGKSRKPVPEGNVYLKLIQHYFICTPTMMIRREVLEELGGYDETLSYEDFDFWIRSSRTYQYAYQDEVLTSYRRYKGSLSGRAWLKNQSSYWESTLKVLKKIDSLNQHPQEERALTLALAYYKRQAYLTEHFEIAKRFKDFGDPIMGKEQKKETWLDWAIRKKIPLYRVYRFYLQVKKFGVDKLRVK